MSSVESIPPPVSPADPTGLAFWHEQLSPAEKSFLRKVEDFAATEVAPHGEAWEKQEQLPRDIFTKAGRLGLLGMTAPRRLGGRGFGYVTYALAVREIAGTRLPSPSTLLRTTRWAAVISSPRAPRRSTGGLCPNYCAAPGWRHGP